MKKARLNKQTDSKKKQVNKNVEEKFSVKTSIITGILMLGALVGFYFLTDKIIDKNKIEEEKEEEKVTVNVRKDNDIKSSEIEKIKDSEYYVLIDKEDDENNSMYDIYINSLKYSNYSTNFYYVDLSKDENKDLLGKEEKLKKLSDLKVKDTTLIHVKDGKIEKTYVGGEKIIEHLTSFFSVSSNSNSNSDSNKSDSNSNKDSKSESNSNKK